MGSDTTWRDERPQEACGIVLRDLVRSVLADIAPEELPVLDELEAFDDATVVRRLRQQRKRREPLGFGLGDIALVVTPIVLLAMNEAAKQAAGAAVDGTTNALKALLRRVFRRRPARVVVPPLAPEQQADVRQRVFEAAINDGLSQRRARVIADAVFTGLALAAAGITAHDDAEPTSTSDDGTSTRD